MGCGGWRPSGVPTPASPPSTRPHLPRVPAGSQEAGSPFHAGLQLPRGPRVAARTARVGECVGAVVSRPAAQAPPGEPALPPLPARPVAPGRPCSEGQAHWESTRLSPAPRLLLGKHPAPRPRGQRIRGLSRPAGPASRSRGTGPRPPAPRAPSWAGGCGGSRCPWSRRPRATPPREAQLSPPLAGGGLARAFRAGGAGPGTPGWGLVSSPPHPRALWSVCPSSRVPGRGRGGALAGEGQASSGPTSL